jgi:hypothetical protein
MNRTKHFTTPAGYTVGRILDNCLSGLIVHAKNILGANGKTDPAARAAFLG